MQGHLSARGNVKLIGLDGTGESIIDKSIRCGVSPNDCIVIQGTSEYFGKSPARIKIALDNKDNPADRYCYNEDDPIWGSNMVLNQSEAFLQALDTADMVVIVAEVHNDVGIGVVASAAMLSKINATAVVTILLKPMGNVSIFPGLDAIIKNSDTMIMISRNQMRQLLSSSTPATIGDLFAAEDKIVSAVISESLIGDKNNVCNIPLQGFKSNGIGYIGIGHGPTIQTGMNRALTCPLLEYSSLERATRILAYFSIRHAIEVDNVREVLIELRDQLNSNVEILHSVRIDEGAGFYGVSLLMTRLS